MKPPSPITWTQIKDVVYFGGILAGIIFFAATTQVGIGSLKETVKDIKDVQMSQGKDITSMGKDIVQIKTTLGIREATFLRSSPSTTYPVTQNIYPVSQQDNPSQTPVPTEAGKKDSAFPIVPSIYELMNRFGL